MTVSDAAARYLADMEPRWKPGTMRANASYVRRRLGPTALGPMDVAAVARADVARWHAAMRSRPHTADRCLALLSGLMRHAERRGWRPEGPNPCSGVRHFRPPGRDRFATDDEYRRIWRAVATLEKHRPDCAAIVRLLILTGCRNAEIRTLQWTDHRDGALHLRDSKTGPRTVWLCSAARRVLDAQRARTGDGRYAFPAPILPGRPCGVDALANFWRHVCRRARIEDLRLHDLRHSYASFALRRGESVTAIGRLLGHRQPDTTLKYLHFADPAARRAALEVGEVLAG